MSVKLDNTLLAFVGESGAGKTTIAEYLRDNYGFTMLPSYTTRPKRSDSGSDHEYVSNEEYSKLTNKVAENCYNGYWYCATEEQCNDNDIYVVDVTGLKQLKQLYNRKKVVSIYVKLSSEQRVLRMKKRGDNEDMVELRILNDVVEFKDAESMCDIIIENDKCIDYTVYTLLSKLEELGVVIYDSY